MNSLQETASVVVMDIAVSVHLRALRADIPHTHTPSLLNKPSTSATALAHVQPSAFCACCKGLSSRLVQILRLPKP